MIFDKNKRIKAPGCVCLNSCVWLKEFYFHIWTFLCNPPHLGGCIISFSEAQKLKKVNSIDRSFINKDVNFQNSWSAYSVPNVWYMHRFLLQQVFSPVLKSHYIKTTMTVNLCAGSLLLKDVDDVRVVPLNWKTAYVFCKLKSNFIFLNFGNTESWIFK